MWSWKTRLVFGVAAVAAVFAPSPATGAAGAPTLAVDRACYTIVGSHAGVMAVSGSGYTAGDQVELSSSDGSVNTQVTADGNGAISAVIAAPTPFFSKPVAKTVTLTAQDFTATGATLQATTPVAVAPLAVETQPQLAKLTSKVTWYFSGFAPGARIYGHYLHKKRQVARTRFGSAHGPCGVLKVHARFYPGGRPRFSRYQLQVDDSRHYHSGAIPQVVLEIKKTLL